MFSVAIEGSKLTAEDITPDLALALACNCVGDASGLEEWLEPLFESGDLVSVVVFINKSACVLSKGCYHSLVDMPDIAVKFRDEWIGNTSVEDDYKYIYDESGEKPQLYPLADDKKTNVF